MARKRDPEDEKPDTGGHPLKSDLQQALDRVGPDGYARATAKDFARGGKYHPDTRKKPRTALT